MNETAIRKLGESWARVIGNEFDKPYLKHLARLVSEERKKYRIYPPQEDVFRAFKVSPYDKTNVALIGQDPYNRGEANGILFDCSRVDYLTPSFKKVLDVYTTAYPQHFNLDMMDGKLTPWARQGALMINAALTVRANTPGWHIEQWKPFIAAVIRALSKKDHMVFVLIGSHAHSFMPVITGEHRIIRVEHPAAAARANRPWAAGNIFYEINKSLHEFGKPIIEW